MVPMFFFQLLSQKHDSLHIVYAHASTNPNYFLQRKIGDELCMICAFVPIPFFVRVLLLYRMRRMNEKYIFNQREEKRRK